MSRSCARRVQLWDRNSWQKGEIIGLSNSNRLSNNKRKTFANRSKYGAFYHRRENNQLNNATTQPSLCLANITE